MITGLDSMFKNKLQNTSGLYVQKQITEYLSGLYVQKQITEYLDCMIEMFSSKVFSVTVP